MYKGDLVVPKDTDTVWESPGVVIRGPYGHVEKIKERWDGKSLMVNETKVVDVLLGSEIISKIPIENLRVLR